MALPQQSNVDLGFGAKIFGANAPTLNDELANKGYVDSVVTSGGVPTGAVMMWPNTTAPTGWVLCTSTNYSVATYPALYAALNPSIGTVTMTIATPAVVTKTAHGMTTGQKVFLTTTGALPTGLSTYTTYWVIVIDANTFNLATSQANALAGTKIATSGSQSGTHSMNKTVGISSGGTFFNVPDLSGAFPVGLTAIGTEFQAIGQTGGAKTHTHPLSSLGWAMIRIAVGQSNVLGRMVSGITTWTANNAATTVTTASSSGTSSVGAELGGATDAGSSLPPYSTINFIIKT